MSLNGGRRRRLILDGGVRTLTLVSLAASAVLSCGGEKGSSVTPAQQLVERSIAFHDPEGVWAHDLIQIDWYGTGDEGQERVNVHLVLHPDQDKFEMSGRYRGSAVDYATDGDTWTATVDGSADISDDDMDRMRFHREGGFFWRSYYGFLAGLPMKLLDPGTRIDADATPTGFHGRNVLSVRVQYDADVGGDTWYFYFDPETAELVGCRFYHDESINDGEFLIFEGLTEAGSFRIPRHRRWFVNADSTFLGADEVRSIQVTGAG